MTDILNELSASAETGVLPETIDRAIEEIERLRAERDKLIQAVADHVTARAEQHQRIKELEELNDKRLGEIQTTLKLLAEARREAAEAQAALDAYRHALDAILEEAPPSRGASRELNAMLGSLPTCGKSALTAAIEAARAEEREECESICKARALKMENEAEAEDADHDDVTSLRSTAWQLTVAANEIKERDKL